MKFLFYLMLRVTREPRWEYSAQSLWYIRLRYKAYRASSGRGAIGGPADERHTKKTPQPDFRRLRRFLVL